MADRFVPNLAAIEKLLHAPSGLVYPHVKKFGAEVERLGREKALVDKGTLKSKIKSTPLGVGPSGLALQVQSGARHSMTIHQGHGVIRPKRSPYLKFQPKDLRASGGFVITGKVRAVAGYPFLTAALRQANNGLPVGTRFKIVILQQPRRGQGPVGAPPL